MLKGFHVAPSLKIITHTQATINRKEKNFIRPNKVHPMAPGLVPIVIHIKLLMRLNFIIN